MADNVGVESVAATTGTVERAFGARLEDVFDSFDMVPVGAGWSAPPPVPAAPSAPPVAMTRSEEAPSRMESSSDAVPSLGFACWAQFK